MWRSKFAGILLWIVYLSEPGSRENLVASKPGVIFRSQKQNGIVLFFTAMPEKGTPAARSFVKNERGAIDGHLRLELSVPNSLVSEMLFGLFYSISLGGISISLSKCFQRSF
ncbi:hypothetical protein AVEN_264749-1 [Araneus ventricosus]|uniref:Uncharacterized protein n=1 Tax=Araneus ventricosus TaxID=182803 RepID=A0A4Y2ECR9_ARAVE|nr:hypothetical protein AVEN_264749-1 [Araneus ventricosus]